MRELRERLIDRWPPWLAGPDRRWVRPLLERCWRLARLDRAQAFLEEHPQLRGLEFVEGALRHVDARYLVDDCERERIPASGACLVVANHPLGGLDALALLKLVGDVRRDVRIVANDWLQALDPLRELLLPVRVFGGNPEVSQLRPIDAALEQGCAVIVFPAGEVARLSWSGLRERRWRSGFVRLALRHQAPVVPVHVDARNGIGFYVGAALSGVLGSALLPRQVFGRRGRRIGLRVATPWMPESGSSAASVAQRTSRAVQALRHGRDLLPQRPQALAHPAPAAQLARALDGLEALGETPDGRRILLAGPGGPGIVLRELARLRERTFRAVGEGTGRALDWDRHDAHYEQIVLADTEGRIVGGYRVARTRELVAARGLPALYCASLFELGPAFDAILDSGLELGRSFVVPEAWGTRSLDYLWLGIGAYLRRHPGLRYLFGTVSISASLPPPAQAQLVGYYRHYFGAPQALARARTPFRDGRAQWRATDLDAAQAFKLLRDNLAALGARVPTLYKQYTELCEPGGAQFLDFGVDHAFADAIDGLILVDLARMQPRKRERYLRSPAPLQLASRAA